MVGRGGLKAPLLVGCEKIQKSTNHLLDHLSGCEKQLGVWDSCCHLVEDSV